MNTFSRDMGFVDLQLPDDMVDIILVRTISLTSVSVCLSVRVFVLQTAAIMLLCIGCSVNLGCTDLGSGCASLGSHTGSMYLFAAMPYLLFCHKRNTKSQTAGSYR